MLIQSGQRYFTWETPLPQRLFQSYDIYLHPMVYRNKLFLTMDLNSRPMTWLWRRCAPYHLSCNSAVERLVLTFKQAMKAGKDDGLSISHRLDDFLLSYRVSPHATTNCTPVSLSLFLGRSVRTRFEILKPDLEKKVCEKKAIQVSTHDRHAKDRIFVLYWRRIFALGHCRFLERL